MAFLASNERIKISATFVNTIAVACVVIGGLTPVIALTFDNGIMLAPRDVTRLVLIVPAWLTLAGILHWFARYLAGRVRE